MLLFIYVRQPVCCQLRAFKYISCYCLSRWLKLSVSAGKIQIHLMLLFIRTCPTAEPCFHNSNTSHVIVYQVLIHNIRVAVSIQIHLMLLFIRPTSWTMLLEEVFKYISCYCLSVPHCLFHLQMEIQIHLMLLFIMPKLRGGSEIWVFKYISCYCLSQRPLCRSSRICDSNTSHVIVYQAHL